MMMYCNNARLRVGFQLLAGIAFVTAVGDLYDRKCVWCVRKIAIVGQCARTTIKSGCGT